MVHAFNAVRTVEHGNVDGKISAFAESCERFQVKVKEDNAGGNAIFAGGDFHFTERFFAELSLNAVANVCFVFTRRDYRKFRCCGNVGFEFVPKFCIVIVLGGILARLDPIDILLIVVEVE